MKEHKIECPHPLCTAIITLRAEPGVDLKSVSCICRAAKINVNWQGSKPVVTYLPPNKANTRDGSTVGRVSQD